MIESADERQFDWARAAFVQRGDLLRQALNDHYAARGDDAAKGIQWGEYKKRVSAALDKAWENPIRNGAGAWRDLGAVGDKMKADLGDFTTRIRNWGRVRDQVQEQLDWLQSWWDKKTKKDLEEKFNDRLKRRDELLRELEIIK